MKEGNSAASDDIEKPESTLHSHSETSAANDNVPGTINPGDTSFVLALGMICVGLAMLAAYGLISGPDDVMTMLRR